MTQSQNAARLALFDFDHTLITTNSLNHLFQYLDGAPPYRRVIAELPSWLRLGDLSSYVAIKTAIKSHLYRRILAGKPVSRLKAAADYAAPRLSLNDEAVALYRSAAAEGCQMVIVTASPTVYIKPLLPLLGIEATHVIGTDLEEDGNGHLTGQFSGPECIRKAKPKKIASFLAGYPGTPTIALTAGNPPDDDALLTLGQKAVAVDKRSGALTILRPAPQL